MYSYVFAIFLFYSLLSIALYSTLKAVSFQFNRPHQRLFRAVLLITAGYLLVALTARYECSSLYRFLTYYMGIISFGFFLSLFYWVFYLFCSVINKKAWAIRHIVGYMYITALVSVVGLSIYNFQKPLAVERYTIVSEKVSRPYRLLHLSDMQYGTISRSEMEEKLQHAYSLNPDYILFTGDLIDFEGYSYDDFSMLQQSPVPIYFERGNHEFYHDPTRLLDYLENIGPIKLLMNDNVVVDELEIVGVDFSKKPNHLANVINGLELDFNKFSILLYHEPRDVEIAAETGFDLMLFGHTHGGQLWPYTWLIDWIYKYGDGYFNIGESIAYTSDGMSLWGPRMRFGSQNEMTMFLLQPAEK